MQLTKLLQNLHSGDRETLNAIVPFVYEELKKLARAHLRREMNGGSLQTTALVHEVFVRLAGSRHPSYEDRSHFYGIASRLMRQVLVDTARACAAQKRGAAREIAVAELPDWGPQQDRSLIKLDDAMRALEESDPRKAQLLDMRYFGGMTAEESATALSMPVHLVRRELRLAQAWLRKEMASAPA